MDERIDGRRDGGTDFAGGRTDGRTELNLTRELWTYGMNASNSFTTADAALFCIHACLRTAVRKACFWLSTASALVNGLKNTVSGKYVIGSVNSQDNIHSSL